MYGASKHLLATKTKSVRTGTSRKQAVNQTLSCAECRRLKLRCDRVFPCGSCQKRGIAELCPEGSLPTRNKPLTASTDKEQLYQHISELRGRVLELEKALETAHASISSEPHPLLGDANFTRKASNKRNRIFNDLRDNEDNGEREEGDTLDEALGSLNVGEDGQTRFFGRSACVERLFKYKKNGALATPEEPNILVAAEVAMVYQSFPMLTIGEATGLVQERIWHHLPPLHRAQSLRQNYRRHIYHITNIIPENCDWFDDIFSRVYQNLQPTYTPLASFSESGVRMDELALLFAYFAMAALMDLDLKPFNFEAEAYACLSRAALTSMNLLKNPSIVAVETLVLLGYFEAMWGEIIGSGDGWIITALATKLAQLIGVHRNSRQFGMEPIESERRSRVYWEIYVLELLEGLSHGRPATFSLIASDVDMPPCDNPTTDYHIFRYRLAVECLAPLSKHMFGIKMPAYTAVVELDHKIRTFCSESGIGLPGQSTPLVGLCESEAMANYMKRVLRESTLLYLHRAFFARAVVTNPSDPQHTKYGLSVSRAYECAMTLVQALGEISQDHPSSSSRALLCWNHTLCSVFILGSITTRCPGSRLAPLAAKRLHYVGELYGRASTYGGRASADRPLVSRMVEKCDSASNAYAREHNKGHRVPARHPVTENGNDSNKREPEDEAEDELALIGGHTRVIRISQYTTSSKASTSPGSSSNFGPDVSPALRNISPPSTDTSSPLGAGQSTEQHYPWEGSSNFTPVGYRSMVRYQARGSSPPSDIADHHISSGGSASSGFSPEAGALPVHLHVQQDYLMHTDSSKPGDMMMQTLPQLAGNVGYEYHQSVGRQHDPVKIVEGTSQDRLSQHEYSSMEVVTDAPESQEWSFLDNWYSYVFSLDVVPPDYGQ